MSAILYLDEHEDAAETKRHVEAAGRRCLLSPAISAIRTSAGGAVDQAAAASAAASTSW